MNLWELGNTPGASLRIMCKLGGNAWGNMVGTPKFQIISNLRNYIVIIVCQNFAKI